MRKVSGEFALLNNKRYGKDDKTKRELEAEVFRIVGEMGRFGSYGHIAYR